MAFNNRGANWLQGTPEIQNPYFGAAMFRCGSLTETIVSTPADTQAGEHQHD